MKKRITTVFLSLLLALSLFMPMNVEAAGSGVHFKDDLGEISDSSMLADLKAQADAIYENTGYQVLFVTTDADEDDDISVILDTTYNSWNGETPGIGVIFHQDGSFVITYYGVAQENVSSEQREEIFKSIESSGSISEAIEACLAAEEACFNSLEPVEKIPLPVGGKPVLDETEAAEPAPISEVSTAEALPQEETGSDFQCSSIRYVDMAGLLDAEDMGKVLSKLDAVSEAHKMNVVIVTTPDLEGKSPEAYADDFFDYNEYGPDGILLLVSTDGNKWHISTTGTAIDIFNEDALEHLSNDFVDYLSDEEFMDAFMNYTNDCDEILTMAENGETYKHKLGMKAILISIGGGFVIALVMAMYKKKQMRSIVAQQSAQDYTRGGSVQIHNRYDNFLNSTITSRTIKDDSDTHTGSSGTDHGGSGGSF